MRNFVVTIDGKSYTFGVEEVGESADTHTPNAVHVYAPPATAVKAAPKISAEG